MIKKILVSAIAVFCIAAPVTAQELQSGYCNNNVLITGEIPDKQKKGDIYVLLEKDKKIEYINEFPVSEDGKYTIKFKFNADSNINDYALRVKAGENDVTTGVITAVTQSEALKFDIKLKSESGADYIDDSSAVNVSGSIKNYYSDGTECVMIAAVYGENNRLISTQTKKLTVGYNTDNAISNWKINSEGAEKIRIFVWNNIETMIPLAKPEKIEKRTYGADVLADKSNTVTAVFLGDSIFRGTGATSKENNFVGCMAANFKTVYSDINAVNAGIGGTYSDQGLYRLQNDVAVYNPDIVFVNFCTNDRYYSEQSYKDYMEGIIRELIKLSHQPVIVLAMPAITFTNNGTVGDTAYNYPMNIKWAQELAQYYSVLFVDYHSYVKNKIDSGEIENWEVYKNKYTTDGVHPNNLGYSLFAGYTWEQIKDSMNGKYTLKSAINHEFISPKLVSANSKRVILDGNWKSCSDSAFKDGIIKSVGGGDKLTLKFSGRSIGFYIRQNVNGNTAKYYIDGQYYGSINSKRNFSMACLVNECHNLSDGEHKLEIITDDVQNENNVFEIGYIAVDESLCD